MQDWEKQDFEKCRIQLKFRRLRVFPLSVKTKIVRAKALENLTFQGKSTVNSKMLRFEGLERCL